MRHSITEAAHSKGSDILSVQFPHPMDIGVVLQVTRHLVLEMLMAWGIAPRLLQDDSTAAGLLEISVLLATG